MIVYRISSATYASDISGEGAKIAGGRWNTIGVPILYTSQHISLGILEILVRADKFTSPDNYTLVSIQIPDDKEILSIDLAKLKSAWEINTGYTKYIGDEFLKNSPALVLKVPSAIVPQEHNFLINPLHKDFKKVKITSSELLNLDKRLLV